MDEIAVKLLESIKQYGFSVIVASVLLWFTLMTVNVALTRIVQTQDTLIQGQVETNGYLRTLVAQTK